MRRRDFLYGAGAATLLLASRLRAELNRGRLDEASSLVQSFVGSAKLRAASLHVRQGSFTFRRSFGTAKTPDAVFLLASISKPMTATGLMVLADRGELALSDPVRKFIPEFSEGDRRLITIQHLLTHTSGLPDQLPNNQDLRRQNAPLKEFVAGAVKAPLLFKPGSDVKYQSMGILLAAEVAERITKKRFRDFLDEALYRPLGMSRTALGLGRIKLAETAQCQVEDATGLDGGGGPGTEHWNWNSPYWRDLGSPWGGAHSTGPDVAKFLEYFLDPDGRVVKPATAKAMITNQNQGLSTPWGIGWSLRPGSFGKACSDETFGHSGSTGTMAWADPKKKLTCVVLTTLPARDSNKTIIRPVSDLVSGSAA
jgi:CubicO group peptidase (beta-lactamase class C family)